MSVALAQEGVGLGRRGRRLTKDSFQARFAFGDLARSGPRPGLDRARQDLRPRHELSSDRKALYVEAYLCDDDARGARPDAKDLVETLEDGEAR